MPTPSALPERGETARLVLRVPTLDDLDELVDLIEASRAHLGVWFEWARPGLVTREWAQASIQRARASLPLVKELLTVIEERATGRIVGRMGLVRPNWEHGAAELAYWLRPDATGRGLASEAAAGMAKVFFEQLDGQRLEVRMDRENQASRAVPERLGFQLEGIHRHVAYRDGAWRDDCVYALIRPDYEALRGGVVP